VIYQVRGLAALAFVPLLYQSRYICTSFNAKIAGKLHSEWDLKINSILAIKFLMEETYGSSTKKLSKYDSLET